VPVRERPDFLTPHPFPMRLKSFLFVLSLSLLPCALAQTIAPSQAVVSFAIGDGPVITSPTSSVGTLGTAFNYQVTGVNNPTGYSATGLPAGLSIDPVTGAITGTPTAFGIFSVNVTITNASGTYSSPFSIDISPWPAPSSTTNAVGSTAGGLSVDPSGAAVYEVPIFTPPGVGGIEPHLSLKYSSNGANGLLGVGWSLSGLSMITRGASSKELYASDTTSLPVGGTTSLIFKNPIGVVMNSTGTLYVADTNNQVIRAVDSSGTATLFAGTVGVAGSANGTGSAAQFNSPQGLAIDSSGNIYVADYGNHLIRKITPSGVVTTLAGLAGSSGSTNGTGTAARFNHPIGVAVNSAGIVYVADCDNHQIRKITTGGVVTLFAGSSTLAFGHADGTGSAATFRTPQGVAVDSAGNLFVADTGNNTIREITAAGVTTTLAGTANTYGSTDGTGSAARFDFPDNIVVDGAGNVYVTDDANCTIRKITSTGVVTTLAGSAGTSGSADGTGGAATFHHPSGIAIDSSSNLYVADYDNNLIRKVTPAGVVTTFAGVTAIPSSDRYFLDGNRLEVVSGYYGGDNSEYRTSVETFSRIIFHNDGTNPQWFEVWTKDGLKMELGNSADARAGMNIISTTYVGAWLLNRVQDLAGNYLNVSYTVNDDSLAHFPYPTEIKYTGNGTTVTPNNSIKFTYELRPDGDKLRLIQMGVNAQVAIFHRLKTISAVAGGTTVRSYTLNYDTSSFTQRSRLTDVQEAGINGTTLPKTSFTWPTTDTAGFTSTSPLGTLTNSGDLLYAADFNGDGKTDVLRIDSTSNRNTQLYLSTGTGLVTTNTPAQFALNPATSYLNTSVGAGNDRLLVGDLNGDGLPDIVATLVNYSLGSGSTVNMTVRRKVWITSVSSGTVSFSGYAIPDVVTNYPAPSGTFVTPPAPLERLMDLDGSGKATLFTAQSRLIQNSAWGVYKWNDTTHVFDLQTGGTNLFHAEDDLRLLEANGDGVADLWHVPQPQAPFNDTSGTVFVNYAASGFGTDINFLPSKTNIVLGDFNGDRLTDALDLQKTGYITGTGLYFRSALNNFFSQGNITAPTSASDWNSQLITAVDLNRDGRDDLIIQRASSSEICYAQGDATNLIAFSAPTTVASGPLSNETVMPIDFNGDGRTDLLVRGNPSAGNTSTSFRVLVANGTSPGDVITRVTNGFGATVDVAYAPLTDATVYTKGTATPAGLVDLQSPIQVVKTVTADLGDVHTATPTSLPVAAGTAASYTQTYKYEGLRSAPYRGVVGFAAQEVTDSRTNLTTRVERIQDPTPANFAENGFAAHTVVKRGTIILSDSTVTPAIRSLNSGITSFVYSSGGTSKTWDISADFSTQGAQTSNQTVTQSVDDWGNVTSSVTTAGFGGRTTSQTSDFWPADTSAGNWLVGRIKKVTTLQQATGYSDVTREMDFYYRDNDADGTNDTQGTPLAPTKTVAFPNDSAKKLTTVYSYTDGFGHVNKVELTGKKDAATDQTRTVSYGYDSTGRFLTTVTRTGPNGDLVESFVPDTLHGAPASRADANNQTTSFYYDDFCRLSATVSPADVVTTTQLAWITDDRGLFTAETHSTFQDIDGSTKEMGPASYTVFDRLGRVVRSEGVTTDGAALTRVENLYNNLGVAWATCTPMRSSDSVINWNQATFDALGRTQTQSMANGGAVSIAYNGPETTSTASGTYGSIITKKTRSVRDLLGRIVNIYKNESLGTANEQETIGYEFDAAGNLLTTTAAGVATSSVYDARGLATSLTDPNTGTSSTSYNAFGEVYSTTDAKTQTVTLDYDILGRLQTRSENEGTTTWTYDSASGKGLGRLSSVSSPDGGGGTYSESYTYDPELSRVASVTKTINGRTCTTSMGYDGASRMASVTYQVPGFANQTLAYAYAPFGGALREVRDMSVPGGPMLGTPLWTLGSVSAFGQPVNETFGNGVTSWTGYRATDGMLEKRQVSNATTYLENLKLGLDPFGNVRRRELCSDAAQNSTVRAEDYGLDLLDRLTSVKLNNTTSLTVGYDPQGNITNKSDVGSYSYSMIGAGPHAVTTAGGTTYGYDANGNLTKRNGVTENSWASFDQPLTIVRNGTTSTFSYGPDRQRIQQVTGVTGSTAEDQNQTITCYFGGGMEHVIQGHTITCRYAVFTPGGRVAEISVDSTGMRTTNYFASDHLGSVEAVTDEQGNVLEQLSYNAWGQRRNADWTAGTPARSTNVNRGFTDHEMLDSVGLVHMNGRVYDPVLARFLRSDPLVSDPMSAQTYNGYSYVGNNPTSATDPSGYDATFVSGGNVPNYNFNFSGGNSNGFSLFGGNVSFTFGGDPFNSGYSGGFSNAAYIPSLFAPRFGASSVFTGLPNVVTGNRNISAAGSGKDGNSTVQNIGYAPNGGWNQARIREVLGAYQTAFGNDSILLGSALEDPLFRDAVTWAMRAVPGRVGTEQVLQFLENQNMRARTVIDPVMLNSAGLQLLINANERFGEVNGFNRFMATGGADIVDGATILGGAAAGSFSPRSTPANVGPTEAYNRRLHYGNTPTAADRRAVGAGVGQVADHTPPLVKRFYEGDPSIGEKPGYLMTDAERKASASDRSRMSPQSAAESRVQGADMSRYSREVKKLLGL